METIESKKCKIYRPHGKRPGRRRPWWWYHRNCPCCRPRPLPYIPHCRPVVCCHEKPDQICAIEQAKVRINIRDSVATMEYEQHYLNSLPYDIQAIYKFPTDSRYSVNGMTIEMEGQVVETDIKTKDKAEEEYQDAVSQGHTAVKMNYEQTVPDLIQIKIGNLKVGKKVKVTVRMVANVDSICGNHFQFIFPLLFIPQFGAQVPVKSATRDFLPFPLEVDCSIRTSRQIVDINSSHTLGVSKSKISENCYNLRLREERGYEVRDFYVNFAIDQAQKPSVVLEENPAHEGEVAAMISFMPGVKEEASESDSEPDSDISSEGFDMMEDCMTLEDAGEDEELLIVNNQDSAKPGKKEETKGEEREEVTGEGDDEMASGEFIFVIDRSGSMRSCERLELAKRALTLFIQSLPADCKFNIVSFGGRYEAMFEQSKKYSQESMKEAVNQVKNMHPNMGGTKIYEPLDFIYKQENSKKYPKSIFLLTDGAVGNSQQVVGLIRDNSHKARVFSFGIGSGASKLLVTESAVAGKGTASFINDGESESVLNKKIIGALKKASKPAISGATLDWGSNQEALQQQCNPGDQNIPIFNGEVFRAFAILDKSKMKESEVLKVKLFDTLSQDNTVKELEINLDKVKEGNSVFSLFARDKIRELKRSNEGPKAEEVSLKYKVLCDTTAFIGVLKNEGKPEPLGEEEGIQPMKPVPGLPTDFFQMVKPSQPQQAYGSATHMFGKQLKKCMFKSRDKGQARGRGRGGRGRGGANTLAMPMSGKRMSRMKCAAPMMRAAPQEMESMTLGMAAPQMDIGNEIPMPKMEKRKKRKNKKKDTKSTNEECYKYHDEEDISTSVSTLSQSGFQAIISHQSFEGNWTTTNFLNKAQATAHGDTALPEALQALGEDLAPTLWLTILAVLLLEKDFAESKDEWMLIVKKAKKFLKKNGVKKVKDFEEPASKILLA